MRCLIWGTGIVYSQNFNCIKYQELSGNIQVIGVTSNTTVFKEILGYPYVYKENIKDLDFDIVIVMGDKLVFSEIKEEAMKLGISEKKIISYKVLLLSNLNMEKYVEIKKNPPTIFANNCWGGLTYNRLGLEFNSPLINMFESDEDYIKFLKNPFKYMNSPLKYEEERFEPVLQRYYPVCSCNDILLYFNHYTSFSEANECWERRKKRINWNNLFIMMLTENQNTAIQFSELPYERKICFVPFKTNLHSLVYVDFCDRKEMSEQPFSKIVNGMASGAYPYYDTIELLYSCNVIKVSKVK